MQACLVAESFCRCERQRRWSGHPVMKEWSASSSVYAKVSSLQIKDVIGERRDMVFVEVRQEEQQTITGNAVELGNHGAWTRWNLPEHQISR